jgi:hypothetical protein
MDVVLGVAVADRVARLALVGSGAGGGGVIDQSVVDLDDHPIEKLAETVVGTNQLLADEHHRLVATRLCWSDGPKSDQLRQALEHSGVQNVAVLGEQQAATALMRAAGPQGSAVLVVGDEAATLLAPAATVEDPDSPPTVLAASPFAGNDATGALDTMMARLGDQGGGVRDVYLVGSSSELTSQVADQLRDASTMRVSVPQDPTFAIARGAAMSALPAAALSGQAYGDATAMSPLAYGADATAMSPQAYGADATAMSPQGYGADATAMSPQAYGADPTAAMSPQAYGSDATAYTPAAPTPAGGGEQQLAYSMADDQELLPFEDEYGDEFVDDEEAEAGPEKLSRGSVLMGNAVVAFAVIGLASLAVAVAVTVRPTAAAQPVLGHQNAAPGKFMPLLPTQQQAPVPPPPADSPNLGYQGGVVPDVNGYIPPQLAAPSGGGGPAPAGPVEVPAQVAPAPAPVPGFVPDPRMPIPVPIFIPFPGWRPPPIFVPPPFRPPIPQNPAGPSGSTTPVTPTLSPPSTQPLVTTPSTPPTPTTPPTPPTPSTKPLVPSTPSSAPSAPSTSVPTTSKQPTSEVPQTTVAPSPKQTSVAPVPTSQQPSVAPPKTQTQQPTVAPPKTQPQVPTVQPQPKPQVPPVQPQPKPQSPKFPGGG